MKHFLLICSLIVATTHGVAYAQAQQTQTTTVNRPVAPSKSAFSTKVNELDKLIGNNKMEDANTCLGNIISMISENIYANKYKIKDAKDAKNDAAADDIQNTSKNQWAIYSEISGLSGNLVANRSKINDKLNEFLATMD